MYTTTFNKYAMCFLGVLLLTMALGRFFQRDLRPDTARQAGL